MQQGILASLLAMSEAGVLMVQTPVVELVSSGDADPKAPHDEVRRNEFISALLPIRPWSRGSPRSLT